jgi:endoribonuclease Dicer
MPSHKLAKQSAALEACRELYRLGELDESLAPVSKDTWKSEIARLISLEPQEGILDGAPKPGTTKRRQYYTKKVFF